MLRVKILSEPMRMGPPFSRVRSLRTVRRRFAEEGIHTVELLHETPFGTDLLYTSSINVDRTVRVTGSIFSDE